MVIYVDIDETICNNEESRNYVNAVPILANIKKINKLYQQGHEVVYWTARGATTGIDWGEVTEKQLQTWGAQYSRLEIGNKPYFDLLIDDKAFNIDSL